MHNFKSHCQRDFVAYYTRPVSVHLAMASVSCSCNSFSIFLLSLKQQQNLMKIMFSCIHFPIWPYPHKNNEKLFHTGKLYGLTGMPPPPPPPPGGFYHMVFSGYLDHQSTQFRLSASELLLFVSVVLVLINAQYGIPNCDDLVS